MNLQLLMIGFVHLFNENIFQMYLTLKERETFGVWDIYMFLSYDFAGPAFGQ